MSMILIFKSDICYAVWYATRFTRLHLESINQEIIKNFSRLLLQNKRKMVHKSIFVASTSSFSMAHY